MKITSLIDKSFFLQNCPLFSSLDMDHLLLVADKLELLPFKKNEHIFFAEDSSSRMYLIVEGSVDILLEKKTYTLEAGEFFGEEGLFGEQKRKYSARVTKAATLLALAKSHLFTLIQEYPEVAINLLRIFASEMDFRPRKKYDD